MSRFLCGSVVVASLVVGLVAVGASAATPAAAPAPAAGCKATAQSLLKQNARDEKQVKKLSAINGFVPQTKTFTPKPTSTKHFTGYETITVKAPKGTTPVVGSFSLTGAERCSVVVTSAQVVLSRNAYEVQLEFPGEQGNPGKLKVSLVSR